jgi:mercuric ion transport protein
MMASHSRGRRGCDPSERRLLLTGIVGTIIAALCCFTPVRAVLFGLVGPAGWLDVVLLPVLAFFVGLAIYAVWRRQRYTRKLLKEHDNERLLHRSPFGP